MNIAMLNPYNQQIEREKGEREEKRAGEREWERER